MFFFGTEWESNVKIVDNTYVAIDYRLTLESGEEFDRSAEGSPLGFVTGTGSIIPGLENALAGRSEGDSFQVTVEPESAYGPVQKELLQAIPRNRFPTDVEIEPGMSFHARGPRGPVALTVVSVDKDQVNVDLNHPLAGKRLTFDVKVQEVRDPLPHEIPEASGCACGPPEQSACGCGPGASGVSGGCGSGSGGCACG
jgi:FKBP-type peptidyl-prolyl cis-trans isomerase SlyD